MTCGEVEVGCLTVDCKNSVVLVKKFQRDSLEKCIMEICGGICRCFVVALSDQLFSRIHIMRLVSQT